MRKHFVIFIFIFIFTGSLLALISQGSLIIPSAEGEVHIKADITITKTEIEVKCNKKIFQPFNVFDAPKNRKMRIDTAEIGRITFTKDGKIYIYPKTYWTDFYQKHRNLFLKTSFRIFSPEEDIFTLSLSPKDLEAAIKILRNNGIHTKKI